MACPCPIALAACSVTKNTGGDVYVSRLACCFCWNPGLRFDRSSRGRGLCESHAVGWVQNLRGCRQGGAGGGARRLLPGSGVEFGRDAGCVPQGISEDQDEFHPP